MDRTVVTSQLFEAFLACRTKCSLLSKGEAPTGSEYSAWAEARRDAYRLNGIVKLIGHSSKLAAPSLEPESWKNESWPFAIGRTLRAADLQADIHLVQRTSDKVSASLLVPVRFIPAKKLSASDKLLVAYEALILSRATGMKAGIAKIVHGEMWSISSVKVGAISRQVRAKISEIVTLLSDDSPPDLVLNRHCPECGFHDRCRNIAVAGDDLSLLPKLTEKERTKFRSRGIFTVTQLSYTFRPRRRSKLLAGKPERYHHALKALAIREKKTHVVGNPALPIEGTPVFLDVEGLPDRDLYYLIGIRIELPSGIERHALWADTPKDEAQIWERFIGILSRTDRPTLVHYGSYEKAFLKKMQDRYGKLSENSVAGKAISSSVNLMSLIYSKIYFPSYSNGLKEIGRCLGFEWTDPTASGLLSIAWRYQWEVSRELRLREKLIAYNADDCGALCLVARAIGTLIPATAANHNVYPEIIRIEDLGKDLTSKWKVFKSPLLDLERINAAAYWNYQRDRVFVRTGQEPRANRARPRRARSKRKAETTVAIKTTTSCPECGKHGKVKSRVVARTVQDLVFGRDSVKRRWVRYVYQTYRCRSCRHEYGYRNQCLHGHKWGWNVVAYFVYHVVGLRIPQLTMQHSMNRLLGFDLMRSTLNNLKVKAADHYSATKQKILERIVAGSLIHADETRANLKGHPAYVWVLTSMTEVVYILAESREGEVIKTLLKDFRGVLVSDFYAAYDSIPCQQQKCLIHLMRDLNDEILGNPFDGEMKSIAMGFAAVLKPIVETIDRRGLKTRFLGKHQKDVDRFFGFLDSSTFDGEVAVRCRQRFEKNRENLFTFLRHDGVPWNNNNAEHAIKAFARLRDVISGTSSKKGVDEYLTLLSVAETCEYRGMDFLEVLRSGQRDFDILVEISDSGRRLRSRRGRG